MILKKSNILLIVVAIFLLISIGSVCASDNITDTSDVPLADDGTDVVLSNIDTDDNVADDTTQEKTNTTVETGSNKYEFKQDADKNIAVNVKDNQSNNINVNKSDLSVMNKDKNISFEYTNSVITITEALPVGNYNLTINYLGNENYISSYKEIAVKIYGNNTIETVTSVVCNGKDVKIPVNVTDQVDYIELVKNNFNITLVYTENGNVTNKTIQDFTVENGVIKFTSDKPLIAASVIINHVNATEPKTVYIKVSTEIEANITKEKFESEEIKNISIRVLSEGNPLNISKNDLKVFDNGKEITNFKYENSNITLDVKDVGVHNITIVYKGNATYNESSKQVVMKVFGNNTIEVPEVVVSNDGKTADIPINLTDGIDDHTDLLNSSNTQVTLIYNGTNKNITSEIDWNAVKDSHKITVNLDKIVPTTLVINYTENGRSIIKNVAIKFNTTVELNPINVNITEGTNATFEVQVRSADGNLINITKDDLTITKTESINKFNESTGVLTLTNLTKGVYNITITFKGNDVNITSKNYIVVNVHGAIDIITNKTAVDVNSTLKGEIKINSITDGVDTFNITKDNLNISVSYKDGNSTKNIDIKEWDIVNGTIVFTLDNGNFTTATLTIDFKNGNGTKNITLNRKYNIKVIPIVAEIDYQDGNFTFKIVDIDDNDKPLVNQTVRIKGVDGKKQQLNWVVQSGTSTFSINSYIDLKTNEEGIATLNPNFYPGFVIGTVFSPVDTYNMTMEKANSINNTVNNIIIKVNKIDIKITIENFDEYYGTDKKFTVTVTNAKTGKAVQGITVNFNITKDGVEISYINGNQEKINTQTTNSEGKIELPASNLMPGKYGIAANVTNGTNTNASSNKGTATIKKIPVVINGKDVSIYYNTGTTYTVKVTKNGKAVEGMYLLVRLYTTSTKYSDYLFQTNSKGQVSFSASLAVGKHKIIISSADNRYEASQITKTITVKKASAKITAKKVTTYYKADKYFTVKLTNTKNKKAIYDAKVNIKIFVSKNRYYNYKGNTGMNGQIKLLLDSLKPGTYKVEVSGADNKNFAAKKVTSKIVIKKAPTKLAPKKVTAKKGKNKYFQVKVTNKKTKKVITGIKIKVKVYTGKKAKTYTLKTDSKGIAKLNVKKLKVGSHKVIVTSANKYCVAKQSKSTIKIKK